MAKTETITKRTTRTSGQTKENKEASFSSLNQLIYLIFGIIASLLGLRFLFKLLGANPGAIFVEFLYGFTEIFMAPFRFVFPTQTAQGAVFEWSILVAIIVYGLLAWILMQFVQIIYQSTQNE